MAGGCYSLLFALKASEPLKKRSLQTQQTDPLGGRGHVVTPYVSAQSAQDLGRDSLVIGTPAIQEAQLVLCVSVSFSFKMLCAVFFSFSYIINLSLALKAVLSGGGGGSDTVAAALDLHVVVS